MARDLHRIRFAFAPLTLVVLLAALLSIAMTAGANETCTGPCLPGDKDGDTIKDYADNCPLNGNRKQPDNDGDTPPPVYEVKEPLPQPAGGLAGPVRLYPSTPIQAAGQDLPTDMPETVGGDECDLDDDNDGWYDKRKAGAKGPDNCRKIANPDQKDSDEDGLGDACDSALGLAAPTTTAQKKVDTRPLKVTVGKASKLRYADLGLGIPVTALCNRDCNLVAELALDRKSAKRAKLPAGASRIVIGRGTSALEGKGKTYVIVRVPAGTLRSLERRMKSVRPVLSVSTLGPGAKKISERRLLIRR